jgi:non-ribosomal peptide synthetase component F
MQTLKLEDRPVPVQTWEVWGNHRHSTALSDGDRQLSYAELDRRADRFAGYLVQQGVVPGGTVAICMERSFDWIVAALGVMRAGAAYVPLDSAWPDSRLSSIASRSTLSA